MDKDKMLTYYIPTAFDQGRDVGEVCGLKIREGSLKCFVRSTDGIERYRLCVFYDNQWMLLCDTTVDLVTRTNRGNNLASDSMGRILDQIVSMDASSEFIDAIPNDVLGAAATYIKKSGQTLRECLLSKYKARQLDKFFALPDAESRETLIAETKKYVKAINARMKEVDEYSEKQMAQLDELYAVFGEEENEGE